MCLCEIYNIYVYIVCRPRLREHFDEILCVFITPDMSKLRISRIWYFESEEIMKAKNVDKLKLIYFIKMDGSLIRGARTVAGRRLKK